MTSQENVEIIQQYLEPKLLGEVWLDLLAGSKRPGVEFEIPPDGASGEVKEPIAPTPIGQAALRRDGADVALDKIPFARDREERALPNVDRIIAAAERCLDIQEVQR